MFRSFINSHLIIILFREMYRDQGPVARSLVSTNRWLRGIKMYRFPWYLTLVSTNHASSNPGQIGESVCGYWGSGDVCGRVVNTCSWRSGIQASPAALFPPLDKKLYSSFTLGPVVWRPISANPGLNFNLGFFFFCSKVFSRIISSLLSRASNYQIVGKKNKTEFASQAFISEINFALTLG